MSHGTNLSGIGLLDAGGAGTYDVWAHGATVATQPFVNTGLSLTIQSSSANDTAAGSGARTVDIIYLDAAGATQTYTATLAGLTPVALPFSAMFLQCAHVETSGTSYGYAAGNITIESAGVVYKKIAAGENRCLSTARMVPAGYRADITSMTLGATGTGRVRGLLESTSLDAEAYGTVFVAQHPMQVQDGSAINLFDPPIIVPELSIIKVKAICEKAAFVTSAWRSQLKNLKSYPIPQ